MSQTVVRLSLSPQAWDDIERLDEHLRAVPDPVHGALAEFLFTGLSVLKLQPGIGRPVVSGLYRELILERGRSGYLARYHYHRDRQEVTILRIRHQRECGYLEADTDDDTDF